MNSLQVYLVMKVNSNPPQAVIAWRSGTEPANKWLTNYLFKRMLRPGNKNYTKRFRAW